MNDTEYPISPIAAARSCVATPGMLAVLSFSPDAEIRLAVAASPITPDTTRRRLMTDPYLPVRLAARLAGRC